MDNFRFYHPMEVRYGDLDPQGHVNNAKYLTYLEQGRISYIQHLGLWSAGSFLNIGIILADVQITFRAPVYFGQAVRVGVRVARLGNKSLTMLYALQAADTGQELARGSTALVAYDYQTGKTIPIPENWRKTISLFEGLEETK